MTLCARNYWINRLFHVQRGIFAKRLIKCSRSGYSTLCSEESDRDGSVVIVGGGIIGCSTAYWLKSHAPRLTVSVVERDPTYSQASTVLSVGGVRLQFSEHENIKMSQFCTHVLNNLNQYFSKKDQKDEELDVHFVKRGYLLLSSKKGSGILRSNYKIQKKLGAKLELLSQKDIQINWPWMNVDDIDFAVYGKDCEGWFDPWLLLCYVKEKAKELGVTFINGTVTSLQGQNELLTEVEIKTKEDKKVNIGYDTLVNAAGCWASEIAEMAEKAIGLNGSQYPLFVKKCKRYAFSVSCNAFPKSKNTPMIIDESGVYFRKENNGDFICGLSPSEMNEPDTKDLEVDYEWFNEEIWSRLCHRVPLMEALKVKSGWAGFYDYNTKDQNLIIGRHPRINNMILCNGSSGHGIQHAMAIGRANMEIILYNKFKTIDLGRLSYDRFLRNELIFEKNIY